jgi:HK97 family phage portal protein
MGLWSSLKSLTKGWDNDGDRDVSADLTGWGMGGASSAGVSVNSFTAMQHVAVLACVSILSQDVAKIPLGVFRRLPNGGKEPARDHPLHRLLRHPNDWQTAFEFKEMMQAALVLRGNAYAVAVRDGRGKVLYLVPVHPDRVALWEAPDGSWFYMVTRNGLHEMAVLKSHPIMIPAEDVLHLRWLSQWNSLIGSSRIGMIRESIGLSMGLEQHQARFTGQGARSGGILSTDGKLGKEVRDQLASDWKKQREGPRNSGSTTILEQGLKWQPLGLSMVDSQFIESRGFQLRDICRAFEVPPYKLAIEGENEGPAMVQMGQQYLNGPVSSYCERWTAKFEKFFDLDGSDLFLSWDYSHFLKADLLSRATSYRQMVGNPIMTVNEARRAEGLHDVPDGDIVLQATNLAPLGWAPPEPSNSTPGSDQTGKPAEGGDGDALRDPSLDAEPGT